METYIVFGIMSLLVILLSWHTLFSIRSHGFYRFFSWICISWLFAKNYPYWFVNPFSFSQIISWIFLLLSLYLVIAGLLLIKKTGKPSKERMDKTLYSFEKTSKLIDTGIFGYIRHPLYFSLILVTWGIFLKRPLTEDIVFAVLSTLLLYITSKRDEQECIDYFGNEYSAYMKRTKMFIPFIF
ncbi:MAG: isoprenylcysteine carboxylmethyltransferase family protein [Bacteroidales bacterium]|nr:isoprenylcysteine carboxylmethyltransferase family protein [Bacteroidales bacterium]